MRITSYGAAEEVTGSQHLLEVNGKRILLECGLFQGKRQEAFEKNATFGFDPKSVDAVLLSHAHIDHSGNIPTLVKRGFRGIIYCTEATHSLCNVMLLDSAYIQESDAEYFSRRLSATALKPIEPLYTQKDAEYALEFLRGKSYGKPFKLYEGVEVTFHEAGHVLGSAIIELNLHDKEDGKRKRLIFTGDLGREHMPIINDPHQVTEGEILLMESTYGNRMHEPIDAGIPELGRVIKRTIARGGKILIPAFALERTQEIIYGLHQLIDRKEIPGNLPIFIDSPLASKITDIFKRHVELYDPEVRKQFKKGHNPFAPHQLKFTGSVEESKQLNFFLGPCIIISASGMCEAGRIRHHLRNNIENPANTVLIVGYMAENTLGRKLVERAPVVKIHDQFYKVNAEVVILDSFSAHADMAELAKYAKNIKGLKNILLVHGEPDQSEPLAKQLKKLTKAKVTVVKAKEATVL